jgi:flavin-dependent dehydrogenase
MSELKLVDGSRIAVIGGGPAGSLFSCFVLEMAERIGLRLKVDVYDPRKFELLGPKGCNMCGGIISETLVQNLATEGISLSHELVQRGIDSYILHTDVGSVKLEAPLAEKRIAAIFRGAGPRDAGELKWKSFDEHLKSLAVALGASWIDTRVREITNDSDLPCIKRPGEITSTYDLVVIAVGVNTTILKLFEDLGIGYERPQVAKTLIREYYLGEERVGQSIGSSMHVFLLDVPGLAFGAIIPKGDYVTLALIGDNVDNRCADTLTSSAQVKSVMPPGWDQSRVSCQCSPSMNVRGAKHPFADRFLFIGDCGVTRLYKDGIGAAYRTARTAARVAVFEGVSESDFRNYYLPVCRAISRDNRIGRLTFLLVGFVQHFKLLRSILLRIVAREQSRTNGIKRMSGVLWDLFSGSALYLEIFKRFIHPSLWYAFLRSSVLSVWFRINAR